MQQTVLKKGELTIREREEEIRLLDLQVAELVRDVEVTRRKLPKIPAAAEQQRQAALAEQQRQPGAREVALAKALMVQIAFKPI